MTTEVYEQILAELQVELSELEQRIFNALKREPEGLSRRDLIYMIYGYYPNGDLANDRNDRKIRMAIALMQERLIPIVSSSGRSGYRLDTSKETAEKMALEMESRARRLYDKARRIRRFYSLEAPKQLRMI